jgi:thioredoxin-related protein
MKDCFIRIKDGEVDNRAQLVKFIEEMKKEEGVHYIKREKKNKRTSPQNRYMHLMFSLIQKGFYDRGYREIKSTEDAKYVMKELFLAYTVENETGGKVKLVRRTRDLNKEQMAEFIDECIQFAAENLDVVIPPPNTQTDLFNFFKAA